MVKKNKKKTFPPLISCRDGTAYIFSLSPPVSPSFSLSHWGLSFGTTCAAWSQVFIQTPLGHFFCRLLLTKTNTFDLSVFPPHPLLAETNINKKAISQGMSSSLVLVILIIANIYEGSARKTDLSDVFVFLHHICFLSTSQRMHVMNVFDSLCNNWAL